MMQEIDVAAQNAELQAVIDANMAELFNGEESPQEEAADVSGDDD
jgi:hypothetical protein